LAAEHSSGDPDVRLELPTPAEMRDHFDAKGHAELAATESPTYWLPSLMEPAARTVVPHPEARAAA